MHFCSENIMIWPIMNYQLLTYFKIIMIRNIPKKASDYIVYNKQMQ